MKYWSDFSHLYYHPRSIVQLNDYSLGSSLQPFENYSSGDELFDSLDKEHDLLDRDLRLWAEECDHMQGVQLFTGADDAWGGFAGRYVERIRDEYGKVGIWVWGIEDDGSGKTKVIVLSTSPMSPVTQVRRLIHGFEGETNAEDNQCCTSAA